MQIDANVVASQWTHQIADLTHEAVQRKRLRIKCSFAAEGQQVFGNGAGMPGSFLDRFQMAVTSLPGATPLFARSSCSSITQRALRNSWATPPANRPTASIFWALRSCASILRASVTSSKSTMTPPVLTPASPQGWTSQRYCTGIPSPQPTRSRLLRSLPPIRDGGHPSTPPVC